MSAEMGHSVLMSFSKTALGLPAPSIRETPIDEASGRDRIFAMAFPTLYPTGQADFNTARVRKVALNDYARHLISGRKVWPSSSLAILYF